MLLTAPAKVIVLPARVEVDRGVTVVVVAAGAGAAPPLAKRLSWSRVPLKRSLSTLPLMPLTLAVLVFCQNVHVGQPPGSRGWEAVV